MNTEINFVSRCEVLRAILMGRVVNKFHHAYECNQINYESFWLLNELKILSTHMLEINTVYGNVVFASDLIANEAYTLHHADPQLFDAIIRGINGTT